jgi:hypothetical protein
MLVVVGGVSTVGSLLVGGNACPQSVLVPFPNSSEGCSFNFRRATQTTQTPLLALMVPVARKPRSIRLGVGVLLIEHVP